MLNLAISPVLIRERMKKNLKLKKLKMQELKRSELNLRFSQEFILN